MCKQAPIHIRLPVEIRNGWIYLHGERHRKATGPEGALIVKWEYFKHQLRSERDKDKQS